MSISVSGPIVWVDDLHDSTWYSPELKPLAGMLSRMCDLVTVTSISALADTLHTLAKRNQKARGLLLDMMLTSNAGEHHFGALGLDAIKIVHHSAGAQIARIMLAEQYMHPKGDTPAHEFVEFHRGCGIAVMSTCYESAGHELFLKGEALDVKERVTQVYECHSARARTEKDLHSWLQSLP